MQSSYSIVLPSPLGKIGILFKNEKLLALQLLPEDTALTYPQDSFGQQIKAELERYFDYPSHIFSLAIHFKGTLFQQKVWQALQTIPSGKTVTYGELAKKLKTSPRAIGQACRTNPIPIIVPCHRVIAATHLGGYAGETKGKLFDIKKWLLRHETI